MSETIRSRLDRLGAPSRGMAKAPIIITWAVCFHLSTLLSIHLVRAGPVVQLARGCQEMNAEVIDSCLQSLLTECEGQDVFPCVGDTFHRRGAAIPECKKVENSTRDSQISYKEAYLEWVAMGLEKAAAEIGIPFQRYYGDLGCGLPPEFDVFVIPYNFQQHRLPQIMCRSRKYVFVETTDPATCTLPSDTMQSSAVHGVFKHHVMEPAERQNGLLTDTALPMYHFAQMAHLQVGTHHRQPPYSPAALTKIRSLVPMAFLFRWPALCGQRRNQLRLMYIAPLFMGVPFPMLPMKQRQIDVLHLNGYMYPYFQPLHRHRTVVKEAVEAFQRENDDLKVAVGHYDYKAMVSQLLRSRILVSPWGFGEWSFKDYEAIICGVVVIKPYANATIEPYPKETYEAVAYVEHDMSNLGEVIRAVLSELDTWQARVDRAREHVKEIANDGMSRYAADLIEALELSSSAQS